MSEGQFCISCGIVSGAVQAPGGVVYENEHWLVVLRSAPVRFPCLPLLILKRHEEEIANLAPRESTSMGQLMQLTAHALSIMLQPARIHFGVYAEEVRHLHVHVFPRMPSMPPGNIPNVLIGQWVIFLQKLGLKKAYSNEVVAQYAEKLRLVYLQLSK